MHVPTYKYFRLFPHNACSWYLPSNMAAYMYKKYYGHKCDDHTQMMRNECECRVRCGGWSLVSCVSGRPELRGR